MGRNNSAERNRRRYEQELANEERRRQEAEEEREHLEYLNALPLEHVIEYHTESMEDVKYVLKRLAKASALHTELLKGLCK